MLPLYLNVIGIILTAIVLFAGYVWMNPLEIRRGADAIEIAGKLRMLQTNSGRFYYSRGTFPMSLAELGSEIELPDMSGTGALLEMNGNIACIAMTDDAQNIKLLEVAGRRLKGSAVKDTCGTVSRSGLIYLAVSIDGLTAP